MSKKYDTLVVEKNIDGDKSSITIVSEFIDNLIKCGYEVFITDDEYCYIIEYNYKADKGYGNPTCGWLTEDEWHTIVNN